VFFDRTYDRNKNGRVDDTLTHIAVVTSVAPDGTVTMVHRSSSKGITKLRMNTDKPDDAATNDVLGVYGRKDRRRAGHLWRGYATIGGRRAPIAHVAPPPVPNAVIAPVVTVSEPSIRKRHLPGRRSSLGRVVRGRRLAIEHVVDASCDDLYLLRNSVFGRHGYAFGTTRALAAFADQGWYTPHPGVNDRTVELSGGDEHNIDLLVGLEHAWGCR
jgi:hypothetical protein